MTVERAFRDSRVIDVVERQFEPHTMIEIAALGELRSVRGHAPHRACLRGWLTFESPSEGHHGRLHAARGKSAIVSLAQLAQVTVTT